jgi:hypothetical protein
MFVARVKAIVIGKVYRLVPIHLLIKNLVWSWLVAQTVFPARVLSENTLCQHTLVSWDRP